MSGEPTVTRPPSAVPSAPPTTPGQSGPGEPAEALATDPAQPAGRSGDTAYAGRDGGRDGGGLAQTLSRVLAEVTRVPPASVAEDSDFFSDLGADSLVMARFCARVRKLPGLPPVSMRDVYQHPTTGSLAAALAAAMEPTERTEHTEHGAYTEHAAELTEHTDDADDAGHAAYAGGVRGAEHARTAAGAASAPIAPPAPAGSTTVPARSPDSSAAAREARADDRRGALRRRYVLCGTLQLLAFLGYSYLAAVLAALGYDWISAGSGPLGVYARSVVFGTLALLALSLLPIAVKWLLVGRWRPREFEVWSLSYVRFWVVRTLIRSDPLVLFVGSPLYTMYLRALGARIGRHTVVLSRNVPACPDLLSVGRRTVIRKDAFLNCYHAEAGVLRTGPVTIGDDVIVSEATVLDTGSSLGDGAQLGHASSLHSGQAVPAGEHWHGSPAQPCSTEFRAVPSGGCGAFRRATHSVLQLLAVTLVYIPLAVGGVGMVLAWAPQLSTALEPGPSALTDAAFYAEAVGASAVGFLLAVPLSLLFVLTVPRLLARTIRPDRVYPLYGLHYGAHRIIMLATNRRFLMRLFGDSSAVVHYLGRLGYQLRPVEQTGSNFGTEVRHETPYLASVGSGTMVADGLSVINADFSHTSFRVSRAAVGAHNFLGNRIAYPSRGRTGTNCLLATKVMVPVDGAVRENTGLLGSPCFEIPRTVRRDSTFDDLREGPGLSDRLAAKNRHNAATMGLYLLSRWMYFCWVTLLVSLAAESYAPVGAWAIAVGNVLALLSGPLWFALVERVVTARHPLRPLFCSIYDRRFWLHERYWKVPSEMYIRILNGTPFKNVVWRLAGVRIGRLVFDDGCHLTERALVTIGDRCTLNAGSVVQSHSQEDGAFKSAHSTVGPDCTLGVGAFVHYGVTMGEGAVLAPDSFLMKGEEVPPGARWGGNPARQLAARKPAPREPAAPDAAVTGARAGARRRDRWER
ncbi:phosphopantetheine-binding protein [Streptomyces sp. LP05-1]|uniref:Phosphopantetheine-binding protein n=1 Tax=Streptomyces pyxinae TaxID=2970734 RepID=A0ABT2CHG6_9ACTN|nr:Pls/PosA family non-ribosomal peptide synthetase [Streptomyces sp. LP05-1]MCS0636862.1 phosphopantetheine-binding protein [Streptomyces sp. LP05-1]